MKTLQLFYGEFVREIIIMRRYFFNSIAGVVTLYLIFLAMFYGLKIGSSSVSEQSLDAMVMGYIMWIFTIAAFQDATGIVLNEAMQGTLEQLALSPLGLGKIVLTRMIVSFPATALINYIVLKITMVTTGRTIEFSYLHFIFIMFLACLSMNGIGMIVGSLGLVFKRLSSFISVFHFLFIGLTALSATSFPTLSKILPFSYGANIIYGSFIKGKAIPFESYGIVLLNSLVWITIGLIVFSWIDRVARRRNLLGQF